MASAPARSEPPAPYLSVRVGFGLSWGHGPDDWPFAQAGACIRCRLHDPVGTMTLHPSTDRHCAGGAADSAFLVSLSLTAEAASGLLADDPGPGAAALRRFTSDPRPGPSPAFTHPLSARARLAVESIRRCPFMGACRTMALTARAHDLLVEFLTAWTTVLQPAPATVPGPDAGVRVAAEILERDLEHPPVLADLAVRSGLSETTLKRNFPRVFGTTVFGYLRRRRMEEARRWLESGTATVLETASRVGYCNPSNFAAAFRREFGVNPKTHQLASRR